MKNKKGIIIFLVFMGLVIIGGSVYFYVSHSKEPVTTQSQDVSTWKTYTEKEYGFEFKYPEHLDLYSSGYKPDWSSLRIELRGENDGKRGGEEITVDVISSGVPFVYNQEESAVYAKQSECLELRNSDTEKIVETLRPNIQKSNWSGFVDVDVNARPYFGRVFVPTKNKNAILYVSVHDVNDVEDTELGNNFFDNFVVLGK